MKKRYLIYFTLILAISHYLHYKVNKIRQPYYNTIFSVPNLPDKFMFINVGDSKKVVTGKLGLPLSQSGNLLDYSKRGNEQWMSEKCVFFQIEYLNDTVHRKFVFYDD